CAQLRKLQMKYPTDDSRARYGRAHKACQKLSSILCYRIDEAQAYMPRSLREGVNFPGESLCLVPTADGCPSNLIEAVRETRTKVLAIERELYLVSDPDGRNPERECFALHRGVRAAAAAAPWPTKVERNFGMLRADALLLAPPREHLGKV